MIKGNKVILRPVEERDLPLLVRWRNDPEIRRYFFSPFLISLAGQKKWFEGLLADRNRVVFMIDTFDGKTVGVTAIDHIDWRNQEAEVGMNAIDPDERGKGYIEEAMDLIIKYCFEELNLHRIYGLVYPFNPAVELYKFFGGQVEGVLRQAVFSGGKFHDKIVMGLLREEWEKEEKTGDE